MVFRSCSPQTSQVMVPHRIPGGLDPRWRTTSAQVRRLAISKVKGQLCSSVSRLVLTAYFSLLSTGNYYFSSLKIISLPLLQRTQINIW